LKNLLIILALGLALPVFGQHKVGVRAGLNYSKFNGPLEVNESYGVSNGFHFGINYTYILPSNVGFRAELLYIQRGTKQSYNGETYYIIRPISGNVGEFVEEGMLDYNIDISTAYLSIPLTVQWKFNRRFEVFAGASLDFLVGPSGKGRADFTSTLRDDEILFIQSHDHSYGSDEAGEYNSFLNTNITILVDGEPVIIPKVVGAYYNFSASEREMGDRLNSFNAHILGGLNYFINSSFYIGARYEYGLLDMTNDAVDYSLGELDEDDNYIFRSDTDKPYSISVSFGFRF